MRSRTIGIRRLLGVFVGIATGKEQQLADGNLDIIRIELMLQLRNFLWA
ncbi:hypothetical protein [Rhizobium sp. Leaf262]|nr:hypothetical protein [Rhizobium sp. Leaf262]